MPLPLSSTYVQEKNKLSTESVWLVLLEIEIPGTNEPVRVAYNTEDITWRDVTWTAFPFEMDEITESDSGEVPRIEVRVGNVNREIELYIHQYDTWVKQNGFEPIVCHIYIVNSLALDQDEPAVSHTYHLIQPKTDAKWARFTLGASNPFNQRFPQRRLVPACPWRFKGPFCGYSGSAVNCDKSFSRCRELGNSKRFGGFYATGRYR